MADKIHTIQDQPYDPNYVWRERNLLSLDGGGTRGLWTLLALKKLMEYIASEECSMKHKEPAENSFWPSPFPTNLSCNSPVNERATGQPEKPNNQAYLPCHYFDVICGASTGGLIALMLGRFRMTVADCIIEYLIFCDKASEEPRLPQEFAISPFRRRRYDSKAIAYALKAIVDRRANDSDASDRHTFLHSSGARICGTFVTTMKTKGFSVSKTKEVVLIRSYQDAINATMMKYDKGQEEFRKWSILMAMRATTASPSYFEPLKIKSSGYHPWKRVQYMDAAPKVNNNPTMKGIEEIEALYGRNSLGVVVSVGSCYGDRISTQLTRKDSTQAELGGGPEKIHEAVQGLQKKAYYRLNYPGSLDMEMDQRPSIFTLEEIRNTFEKWSAMPSIRQDFERCAEDLVKRRRARLEDVAAWEHFATDIVFKCGSKGCSRLLFIRRDKFMEHLEDKHRDSLPDGKSVQTLAQQCSSEWRYRKPKFDDLDFEFLNLNLEIFTPWSESPFPNSYRTIGTEYTKSLDTKMVGQTADLPQNLGLGLAVLRHTVEENAKTSEVMNSLQMVLEVDWQVWTFIEEEIDSSVDCADIFILIGTADAPQGLTCHDYMIARWPNIAQILLSKVQKAVGRLRKGTRALFSSDTSTEAVDTADRSLPPESSTLEFRHFEWKKRGIGHSQREHATIKLRGPTKTLLDCAEAVAWLTAALRPTLRTSSNFHKSDVDFNVSKVTDNTDRYILCNGSAKPMIAAVPSKGHCWHALFKNATIVNCPTIQTAQKPKLKLENHPGELVGTQQPGGVSEPVGLGLELPFDGLSHLMALSGANRLVEHKGELVLLGISAILVPYKRLDGQALQWHLIWESTTDHMISLNRVDEDRICSGRERGLLQSNSDLGNIRSHFVGLWKEAVVVLGTEKYQYKRMSRCNYQEAKYDKTPATLGFNAGVSSHGPVVGAAKTYGYTRTQLTRASDPTKQDLSALLEHLYPKAAIIYESSHRRAWLVPQLSLVLHVTQVYLRFRPQGAIDGLQYATAQADGASAAWEILKSSDDASKVCGLKTTTAADKNLVEEVLYTVTENLRRMEARQISSLPLSTIKGYDLADLSTDSTVELVHTEPEWNAERSGWCDLTSRIPLLLCPELAPPVRPTHSSEEFTADFRMNRHLVCPISCLDLIKDGDRDDLPKGKICKGIFLHSPHTPFGRCNRQKCSVCLGDEPLQPRVQYFIRSDRAAQKWTDILKYKNATILVSPTGSVLHKGLERGKNFKTLLRRFKTVRQESQRPNAQASNGSISISLGKNNETAPIREDLGNDESQLEPSDQISVAPKVAARRNS